MQRHLFWNMSQYFNIYGEKKLNNLIWFIFLSLKNSFHQNTIKKKRWQKEQKKVLSFCSKSNEFSSFLYKRKKKREREIGHWSKEKVNWLVAKCVIYLFEINITSIDNFTRFGWNSRPSLLGANCDRVLVSMFSVKIKVFI